MSLVLLATLALQTPAVGKDKPKTQREILAAQPDPVWPPAPNEPRLKWVALYHDAYDVGAAKRSRFMDALTGTQKQVVTLRRPVDVAADRDGRIYVGDFEQGVILIDPARHVMERLNKDMGFRQLTGVAVDDHFLYVSDAGRSQIFILDKQGNTMGALGQQGDLLKPDHLALSPDGGTLWVADAGLHQVVGFDLAKRTVSVRLGHRGSNPGEFNFPVGVATLSNGDLVVGDFGNFRVQVLTPKGRPIQVFGKTGDLGVGAFQRLKGVAVDPDDHIYAADSAFDNIQVFDSSGKLLTVLGGTGRLKGQFDGPIGLCFQANRLYIADQLNQRVQVIDYLPEPKRKGGRGKGEQHTDHEGP